MASSSVAGDETGNSVEGQFLAFHQAMFGAPCPKQLDPLQIDDCRAVIHTSIGMPDPTYIFEGGDDCRGKIGRLGEHMRWITLGIAAYRASHPESGPTSCWRPGNCPFLCRSHRKPNGAGIPARTSDENSARSRNNIEPGSCPTMTLAIHDGAITAAASIDARTALTLLRSQRTALGKLTSSPRRRSAAASILRAERARMTASSIVVSSPGNRTARKSGSRLNVRRLVGQYHRAIRTPGVVSRL